MKLKDRISTIIWTDRGHLRSPMADDNQYIDVHTG